MEYRLPTVEGRELLVRPCVLASKPQLQIAVRGKRGGIVEAVTIEVADILGLARGLAKVGREADRSFAAAERSLKAVSDARYQAALGRNPWQTLDAAERKQRGLA